MEIYFIIFLHHKLAFRYTKCLADHSIKAQNAPKISML